jgi:hypothetical protein
MLRRCMKYEGGNCNCIHYTESEKNKTLNVFELNRLNLIRNTLYLNMLRTGTPHTKGRNCLIE